MFWMLPPPYLRWLAAALVFTAAAYLDVSATSTAAYPFAAEPIEAGEPVGPSVAWRDVPAGLLPPMADLDGYAARALASGEPLVDTAVRTSNVIPGGWWAVPVELPPSAGRGASVRLVSPETGLDVAGFVTEPAETGAFATVAPGLVAVPPDAAGEVAAASAAGRLIVLLQT